MKKQQYDPLLYRVKRYKAGEPAPDPDPVPELDPDPDSDPDPDPVPELDHDPPPDPEPAPEILSDIKATNTPPDPLANRETDVNLAPSNREAGGALAWLLRR